MILANVLLVLFFALANYYVWVNVNREGYYTSGWSPIAFTANSYAPIPVPPIVIPNIPFYVFCAAIAVNLIFIIRLGRSKETKPTT
jgi:hypothetical protein